MNDRNAACEIANTALTQASELIDECEQVAAREQF